LYVASITERHANIQKLRCFKQNKAYFTHKRKAAVSHRIWTILPWWATKFCQLAREIWQNLLWKTVGPSNNDNLGEHGNPPPMGSGAATQPKDFRAFLRNGNCILQHHFVCYNFSLRLHCAEFPEFSKFGEFPGYYRFLRFVAILT